MNMRIFFITILSFCIILFSASTAPCVDDIIIITDPTLEEIPQEFKQEKFKPKKDIKDNISFRGFIQAKGAVDTNNDSANEHDYTFYNNARLEGKWTFEGNRNYIFASIDSEYLWFGPYNDEEDYDFDLFEGYIFWATNSIDLTVGKQIIRWGKTDQISPVDNLNPQDLREFIIPDFEDRKIPNWMARGRFFSDFATIEGVYLPFFEPSRMDYFGTDWAIFQHLNQRSVHEEEPASNLKNGECGVRVTTTVAGWDLGLSYLYAWEDLPYFETFPTDSGDVRVTYKRLDILGFEFETTVGEIGLRGEAAYFDSQSFLTENLTSTRKIVYHYILGVDYSGENDWYINIQFSHQIIKNYDSTILYFNRNNPSLCGEISKEFWEGYFEADLKYNFALNENSFYLSPRIICSYVPNLDITLGLNIFEGDPDTLMGLYDANDQVYIDFKYHF